MRKRTTTDVGRRSLGLATSLALLAGLTLALPANAQPHLVDAGKRHVLASRGDGTVWAWGRNTYGQLGHGLPIPGDDCAGLDSQVPVQVTVADGSLLTGVTAVAGGDHQSAAIDLEGHLWTWGRNDEGQLGDGQAIGSGPACRPWADRVVDAAGQLLDDVVAIDSGLEHMVAVRADGSVWAWGGGGGGQVGDGFGASRPYAVRVVNENFAPLENILDVAAGRRFNVALDAFGRVFSWGSDEHGQLGDDGSASGVSDWAVEVRRAGNQPLENVRTIAAGRDFAVAYDRDGVLWAWGANQDGQFGDGSRDDAIQARQVPLPFTEVISHLDAGFDHTYAVTVAGGAWAWGSNDAAQLGGYPDDQPYLSLVPVPILDPLGAPLTGVRTITAGKDSGFALTAETTVLSWGEDDDGQLGRPTTPGAGHDHRPLPVLTLDGEPLRLDIAPPAPTLTVVKQGSAGGLVFSTPAAIDCPEGCEEASATLELGSSIRLDAAEGQGSDFAGFTGGPCAGENSCELLIEHDELIHARFEVEPPLEIINSLPVEGRVGVAVESVIELDFNRPVVLGPGALEAELLRLPEGEAHAIHLQIDPSEETRVLVEPESPLSPAADYELRWPVDAAVDDEGAGLEQAFVLAFSTRPDGETRLALAYVKEALVEGDSQTAWVWLDRRAQGDRVVQLFTEPTGVLDLPSAVVIAEGEIGTAFTITAVDTPTDSIVRLHAAELAAGQVTRELVAIDSDPANGSGFEYFDCTLLGELFNDGNGDQVFDAGELWELAVRVGNLTGHRLDGPRICFEALDFRDGELMQPDCANLPTLSPGVADFTRYVPIEVDRDLASGTYHLRISGSSASGPGFVGYCAIEVNNSGSLDYSWARASTPDWIVDAGATMRVEYQNPDRIDNGAGEPPPPVRFWLEDSDGGLVWERFSWADVWTQDWPYVLEFRAPDGPAEFTVRSEINPPPAEVEEPYRGNNEAAPFSFTARRPNVVPAPAPIPDDLAIEVEQELLLAIEFVDGDGDSLSFRLLEAPVGATVENAGPVTALVRWTPSLEQGPDAAAEFELEADDGFRGVVTVPFEVEVTYSADLAVSINAPPSVRGEPIDLDIRVRNLSPSRVRAAGLVTTFDPAIKNLTWTCASAAGSCTPAGSGPPLDGAIELAGDSEAIFRVSGHVPGEAPSSLFVNATLDHPGTYTDPAGANDTASKVLAVVDAGDLLFHDGFDSGDMCRWSHAYGTASSCGP